MKKVLLGLLLVTSFVLSDNYVKSEWTQEGFTTKVEGRSVTFSRWHHEAELKVTYDGSERLKVTKSELGTDVDIVLTAKPASNSFSFTLSNFANFDFFEQRALNEENHLPRYSKCTANDCVNGTSHMHRDDEIIDSIAVYHKKLKNHWTGKENYEAGKFTHIYRAKAIDANGKWAYGKLKVINNKLIEEFPKEFLSSASYPVVLDPTFGYQTQGASDDNPADNWIWFESAASSSPSSPATPASNGTLTGITVYGRIKVGTVPPHFATALYSSTSNAPVNRLAAVDPGSGTLMSAGNTLTTTSISYGSITASTQYFLGISVDWNASTSDLYWRWDTNGGATEAFFTNDSLGMPWPASAGSPITQANERATLYATYTSSGGTCNGPLYVSNFPLTENPINEGSCWVNGHTTGIDWSDVRTNGTLAYGQQAGTGSYDDSIAFVNGTWAANQKCEATVYATNQGVVANKEVECWLHGTFGSHSLTGYECNVNTYSGNPYAEIVRSDVTIGTFMQLSMTTLGGPPITGDTYSCTIVGTTIKNFLNGVQIDSVTDGTYTTGTPGIGMFLHNLSGTGNNVDFGFTHIRLTEIGAATKPRGLSVLNIGSVLFQEVHNFLKVRN